MLVYNFILSVVNIISVKLERAVFNENVKGVYYSWNKIKFKFKRWKDLRVAFSEECQHI